MKINYKNVKDRNILVIEVCSNILKYVINTITQNLFLYFITYLD